MGEDVEGDLAHPKFWCGAPMKKRQQRYQREKIESASASAYSNSK